jgi:hypothetical protein
VSKLYIKPLRHWNDPIDGGEQLRCQRGQSKGGGLGAILFVPAGDALCLNLGSATSVTGSISYAQF